ncbi:hypothetical protein D5R81_16185 [Parashewanella spongiae]|uniref:InsA N-terminal zinc ribbon domain-containing protein n=1 Tax=Parashewanella spongiae TaxID=342950 RepID=A0A3A6TZT6_9GAMM|nr:hypothetical protein D5R81_16185 [Parashewanella spongiae]
MRHSVDVQSPHCQSTSISKAGKSPKEQQRYLCTNSECPKKHSYFIMLSVLGKMK